MKIATWGREAVITSRRKDQSEPLPWSDSFSGGHPELDTEHRLMLDLINRICIGPDAGNCVRLLSELESLTERHFEHEEAVLQ